MSFYEDMARTSLELISEFGKNVSIVNRSGAHNPIEGTVAIVKNTSTAKAVQQNYSVKEIDGTTIKKGDKKYLLAASGLHEKPSVGMELVDEKNYSIISVEEIKPADVPLVYFLQVR